MTSKLQPVRLIVFNGVQNLPNFAAEKNGYFTKRGIAVETTFTKNSEQQRDGLADGTYDIAHAAVDNAIAMVEAAGQDVVIFCGLDYGYNRLIVQPGIKSYEDLRGKTLAVDAPDTAFALVAYELLKRKGLNPGDYKVLPVGSTQYRLDALKEGKVDVSMLNLPFNIFAQRAGLAILENPSHVVTDYQSTGGFVQRAWAEKNHDLMVQYTAAYIEGLRWVLDPANAKAAIALLVERMKMAEDIASEAFAQVSDAKGGFTKDAKLSMAGMAMLLKLRTTFAPTPGIGDRKPERYVDETYYNEALAVL
jgi:ABC-type nitrate/sulfonate/bicarbonate transport system substrate-binding protein